MREAEVGSRSVFLRAVDAFHRLRFRNKSRTPASLFITITIQMIACHNTTKVGQAVNAASQEILEHSGLETESPQRILNVFKYFVNMQEANAVSDPHHQFQTLALYSGHHTQF